MNHPTPENTKPGDFVRHIASEASVKVYDFQQPNNRLRVIVPGHITKTDIAGGWNHEFEILGPVVKLPATCNECQCYRENIPNHTGKHRIDVCFLRPNRTCSPNIARPDWCPLYNGGLIRNN